MKKTSKILAVVLVLVLAVSMFASCGQKDPAPVENKTLIMGTSADYAPFEFMYPNDKNELVYGGIDVFAAEYIAADMGKELKIENMAFDSLLTSLAKGDFDMVMAGIEVTDDRKASCDPSDPYYTDYPAMFLVKAANADKFQKIADFKGASVGAQTATTKLDQANEIEGANVVALVSVLDLINELNYDKVDAVLLDGSVAMQYAESNKDFVVAKASEELGEALPYCIWVQKGDPKGLLPGINAAVKKMLDAKKMDEFIAKADSLADVWQEVSA